MTLAVLTILTAIILIGPPVQVQSGSGGRNTMLGVTVPPDAETEASGQSPAGRLAQERGEWKLAKLFALPFAGVAAYFAPDGLIAVPIALVAFALAELLGRKLTGHWDYVGHNIEIMVAEAEGREGYREAETRRVANDKGITFEQAEASLRKWALLARVVKVLT